MDSLTYTINGTPATRAEALGLIETDMERTIHEEVIVPIGDGKAIRACTPPFDFVRCAAQRLAWAEASATSDMTAVTLCGYGIKITPRKEANVTAHVEERAFPTQCGHKLWDDTECPNTSYQDLVQVTVMGDSGAVEFRSNPCNEHLLQVAHQLAEMGVEVQQPVTA